MKIVWLPDAVRDLERLRCFIEPHNAAAARRAAASIRAATRRLKEHPYLGRAVVESPAFRDLVISFGSRGYLLRYRIQEETVVIVHIRHGLEEDFR